MSIPKIMADLAVIQTLSDLPNSTDGLTAQQLKAKFDEAALTLKTYINETLIPSLTAAKIPFAGTTEINAENIQDAIASVHAQIRDAAEGTLVNGSVTREKLATELLKRVFGGRPWVSMEAPDSADDVSKDFPVGQIWLRPGFTVVNAASDSWSGNGCSVTDGVLTGNQTASTATISQSLANIGQSGDRVRILFDIADKNTEVSAITIAINGGAAQDASGGMFEAELTAGGALHVVFTTTWPSASLASGGWTLENYTVVNLDQIVRQTEDAAEIGDWAAFLSGLMPFETYVSPETVYIQTISGSWWPLTRGIGGGELLVGSGERGIEPVARPEEAGSFLRFRAERPVWEPQEAVVQELGALRMMSGSYEGTSGAWTLELPLAPKLLTIAPEGGPVSKGSSSVRGYYDNPAVLLNGAKASDEFMSGSALVSASVSLSGDALAFTGSGGAVNLCNRSGVTYHWVAVY